MQFDSNNAENSRKPAIIGYKIYAFYGYLIYCHVERRKSMPAFCGNVITLVDFFDETMFY